MKHNVFWLVPTLCLGLLACGGDSPPNDDVGPVVDGGSSPLDEGSPSLDLPNTAKDEATANGGCGAEPCGGDVVGNWAFTRSCEEEFTIIDMGISACPGMGTGVVLYAEGGLEIRADGTLTVTKTLIEVTETFSPTVCSGANCELMNGFDECTVVSDGCSCTVTNQHETVIVDEPWSTDGTTFTSGEGEDEGEVEYCVTGDLLKLIHLETGGETFLTRE